MFCCAYQVPSHLHIHIHTHTHTDSRFASLGYIFKVRRLAISPTQRHNQTARAVYLRYRTHQVNIKATQQNCSIVYRLCFVFEIFIFGQHNSFGLRYVCDMHIEQAFVWLYDQRRRHMGEINMGCRKCVKL